MIKNKTTLINESQLDEIIKKNTTKVLGENTTLELIYDEDEEPMTLNQKMSLNEMARINVNEKGTDKNSNFDCNSYYVYVKGEGGYTKFPHFHIKSIGEGWDIRMNMDGSLHSIKTKGGRRKSNKDFVDIERIAKVWVNQYNVLEPDKTNGKVAEILWTRNND